MPEYTFKNTLSDRAISIGLWELPYLIHKIHSANNLDHTKINEAELLPLRTLSAVCGWERGHFPYHLAKDMIKMYTEHRFMKLT